MCPSLQVFIVQVPTVRGAYSLDFMAQVPSGLQRFVSDGFFQETFPRWINPSLCCLTVLSIRLWDVCVLHEHLENLAGLPSLRFLQLVVDVTNSKQERLVFPIRASAFPCLTELEFECDLMFLKFQHGAMRKLQRLVLEFGAHTTNNWIRTNNSDFGLENLPSLRHVVVRLHSECLVTQDAIRKAINHHPNHPSLDISFSQI
jgi:hypothetical protein